MTFIDAPDCGPVPTAFFAATLSVYVVPLVKPVTVSMSAVELNVRRACAVVPMNGVTTYPVTGDPPLAGVTQFRRAWPLPGAVLGAAGADGGDAAHAGVVAAIGPPATAANSTDPTANAAPA